MATGRMVGEGVVRTPERIHMNMYTCVHHTLQSSDTIMEWGWKDCKSQRFEEDHRKQCLRDMRGPPYS